MLPRINPRGTSFKGITSYLLHGKIGEENAERVEWSMTGNMYTNDIEKAAKVMAFTAMNAEDIKRESGGSLAGAKAEGKAVYHNTLSWRVGDSPSEQHMKETALDYLVQRKLENQEYYIVAHNDTDHKHLHIVVNLVDHETGKTIKLGRDKMAAQAWALEYERKHGIQCELREENAAKREQGQAIKHQDKKQDYSGKITRAYYAADNGKSFINALNAEGLNLAKARRGNSFVVVDEKGDIQKLARQLDIEEKGKQKTAAIVNLLKDVDREKIEDAAELSKKIKINIEQKQEIFDRDEEETKQQKNLSDASEKSAAHQEREVNRIAGDIRLKLWDKHEINLKVLKKKQGYELSEYVQNLRDTDSEKEAQHRAFYAPEISADRQEKLSLQQQLKGSGLKGSLFRIRHGKKTISRIKALENNIANGEMRLNEGVGGIDRFDYKKIQKKKAEHRRAIDSFKNNHDRDIKKAEQQAREQIERITNDFSTQENIKFNIEKTSKTTMDRNPLYELRGGVDKAGREERNNSLSVGQGENRPENIELLQIQAEGKRRVEEATRKAQEAQQEQQKQIEIQRAAQAQKQLQAIKEAQKQTVKQSLSNDNFGDEFLSKDEIAENVKAQQSQHQNNGLSGSFMDELSAEQRQKIEDYKENNPAPDHDDTGEKQERGHRPELD